MKKIGYACVRFTQNTLHSSSIINVIGFRMASTETHVITVLKSSQKKKVKGSHAFTNIPHLKPVALPNMDFIKNVLLKNCQYFTGVVYSVK